ncbi:PQQ-binding-like beta-propeller repeat protein [Streptomyces sp. NBC_00893]|uniref:outer membrane protein assembly factor BamB family protein n=1 Tax=Streptomyces sp. NBC_00893 TaxID=2975862 RepID=UPI00224E4CCA|nr:PQQ-binding-like beta-propeller repeat protein [Streptomyces sp. NBC_00893]MCX4847484.1 PQQ-binding-like beta-propeller repeat protein [Streptomyces sp. NBC_00893]
MTQPPGQQPPQGGFGAPYEPQPGSYGPPAQPPTPPQAQPPTQPPGPYGPPPGPYGPPPAQPGPYNAPAQPGPYNASTQPGLYNAPTQPGPYGVPSSPQSGGPAGGSGGGGFFRGRRGAVIGAVLAVVLLAGGGVWLATSGSDGKKPTAKTSADPAPGPTTGKESKDKGKKKDPGPGDLRAEADGINAKRKAGEAKVQWLQEGGVDLPRNGESVYGPWFVGDTVVKAMFHTVSGYSVADGSEKWSLRLPGKLCGAPSQTTADGKIVFGVQTGSGSAAECNGLQMADLTTGKAGWYKTFERQGTWDLLSDTAMAINGDTVTVGRKTRTDAFRVSDGKVLFGKLPGNCQPFGFASGPLGIAAASCQTAADDHKEQLVERIDPVSGKVLWKYKVKKGWEVSQFYSVSPLVVSLKKDRDWAIIMLDANGAYRSQLVGGTDNYRVECDTDLITGGGNLDNCLGVATDDRTVYLATKHGESDTTTPNKIVAFDVSTGRTKWKAAAPAGQTMMPMRVEDGRLLVFVESSTKKAGAIASLPPTGGTPRMLLRHPDAGVRTERSLFQPRVAYVNGRSLLMSTSISGVEDGDEERAKSMEMFGS